MKETRNALRLLHDHDREVAALHRHPVYHATNQKVVLPNLVKVGIKLTAEVRALGRIQGPRHQTAGLRLVVGGTAVALPAIDLRVQVLTVDDRPKRGLMTLAVIIVEIIN